ncbi:pectin lyase fold/virulence factor [Fusarium venenatum]|uniref:pectin lyase fold/virulence factor n=1 Tax=Fusarium venenatum TaxID=56646 RepID=UPI001D53BB60|nr:pectin lyase fold/virulence factor [Fusarium venenatum]
MRVFLYALYLSIIPLSDAADIYLDPKGLDSNPGSAGKPVKSIKKAQELARELISSTDDDITVHFSPGTWMIDEPISFTGNDSGISGATVKWVGSGSTISGGLEITNWVEGDDGIWSASVPSGTNSRNLFVNGFAAQYARRQIHNRKDFNYTKVGMTWNSSDYDWIMETPGIENGELRAINSFTDRIALIDTVEDRVLKMKSRIWANQIIGYDQIAEPFWDGGMWIQNVKAFLTDGGQFYLDKNESIIYYKPLEGDDMTTASTYLGIEEVLLAIGGTYEEPVHNLHFEGITFEHSTWLKPDIYGYIDQQTGGHMGNDSLWPEFEASRPHWWQMPSAIQISAAHNISMQSCTFRELGAGGIGVGNDKNAHFTGIGLGGHNINISENYFTQVMGNSITVGGIQADAHHPSESEMLLSHIHVSNNVFNNNSVLWSSTVPILFTYTQFSSITHNDIYNHPYSGVCHGYGWGSNDAGGSEEYIKRGLYKYQPIYYEPTVMKNNLVEGNLIHHFGQSHTDFGGVYTLSQSPNTTVSSNFIYDAGWQALYPDEASRNITWFNNLGFTSGKYYAPNDWIPEQLTGWNTVIDNWGKLGIKDNEVLDGFPNFSGRRNNTFLRNFLAPHVNATSLLAQRAAYRAGVIPSKRKTKPVTNCPDIADGHLDVQINRGRVFVNVTNFDDVDFVDVSFHLSGVGVIFKEEYSPSLIPADDYAMAVYTFSGSPEGNYTARVNYVNPWTRSSSRQKEFSLTA